MLHLDGARWAMGSDGASVQEHDGSPTPQQGISAVGQRNSAVPNEPQCAWHKERQQQGLECCSPLSHRFAACWTNYVVVKRQALHAKPWVLSSFLPARTWPRLSTKAVHRCCAMLCNRISTKGLKGVWCPPPAPSTHSQPSQSPTSKARRVNHEHNCFRIMFIRSSMPVAGQPRSQRAWLPLVAQCQYERLWAGQQHTNTSQASPNSEAHVEAEVAYLGLVPPTCLTQTDTW